MGTVLTLVVELGMSQCRACLVVDQHCCTQRHCLARSSEEDCLWQRIRALAVKHGRIHVMLIHDVYQVNRKRVQRLWRLKGLRVQRPKRLKPKIA